jgi:hypothetical protein
MNIGLRRRAFSAASTIGLRDQRLGLAVEQISMSASAR